MGTLFECVLYVDEVLSFSKDKRMLMSVDDIDYFFLILYFQSEKIMNFTKDLLIINA